MKVWEGKQVVGFLLTEDYYDLNYNGRTKLSIFLICYINIVCFFGNINFALTMHGFCEIAGGIFEVNTESNMADEAMNMAENNGHE